MDKIICIGKNYLDHAKELGDAIPDKPVLFLKPPSAAQFSETKGTTLCAQLPQSKGEIHYECELIFKIQNQKITHFSLGLDMTLRDLQKAAKKNGLPWETSKVFKDSALVGPWVDIKEYSPHKIFRLELSGVTKQQSKGSQMIFSPEECLYYAKNFFDICDNDILFTGTPAGVGPALPKQHADLYFDEKLLFSVKWA